MPASHRWFFPPLGGGEEQGLNEPGVEAFRKGQSLGRETLQNIGDARSRAAIERGEPAIAEFELLEMPTSEMPGHEDFLKVFRACRDYVPQRFTSSADREANGLQLFARGVQLLEGNMIPVLRIRDRNTTGLRGSTDLTDKNTPWWRLIRGQGYSSREGVGGGTYGIGQRAPFAFSDLRTVVYYTRTGPDSEAFVAKSVLCSFPDPQKEGTLTQRTGWYCQEIQEALKWTGITDPDAIPDYFRRKADDDVGTDLYIIGYRDATSQWRNEVRQSILRNFFAAIHQNMLTVRIIEKNQVSELTAANLSDMVRKELKELKSIFYYLRALEEPVSGKPFKQTFENLGELKLYVHLEKNAPNRWISMRQPRIVVEDHGSNALAGYAAVLVCDDGQGNSYLASMEDPTHSSWDANNAESWTPKQKEAGRKVLAALRKWIRETLRSLGTFEQEDLQDIAELADLLPEEDSPGDGQGQPVDESPAAAESGNERENEAPHPTDIVAVPPRIIRQRMEASGNLEREDRRASPSTEAGGGASGGGSGGGGSNGGSGTGLDDQSGSNDEESRPESDADGGDGSLPNGTGPREGYGPAGSGVGVGEGETSPNDSDRRPVRGQDVAFRSYALSATDYRIVLRARRNCKGSLVVRAVAEDGRFPIVILSANSASGTYQVSGTQIQGIDLAKGKSLILDLNIQSEIKLALGIGK